MARKLQRQTQQRDGVQPETSELPGCPSAWTTGRMDRGRMTRRTDSEEASFLIPTSFTICNSWFISFPFLVARNLQCQTQHSAEGWCAAGNLGTSRVSIRMDDRTDGQREDDGTDDGTHGFRGGFISHPDVLYYM